MTSTLAGANFRISKAIGNNRRRQALKQILPRDGFREALHPSY
ncbi:hypothetical protein [Phormidium nigroviride]